MKENVANFIAAITHTSEEVEHFQDVYDDANKYIGFVEKLGNNRFVAYDRLGRKIGNSTKHLETTINKIKTGSLTTPESYVHKKQPKEVIPNEFVQAVYSVDRRLGSIERDSKGRFVALNHNGEKLGYASKSLDTAIEKVRSAYPSLELDGDGSLSVDTPQTNSHVSVAGGAGYILEEENGTWTAFDENLSSLKTGLSDPAEAVAAVKEYHARSVSL